MTTRYAGRTAAFVIAIFAVAIAIIGLFASVRELVAVLLVAYLATTSMVLGVLAMIMIAHLTTATWFGPFRRRADAVVGSLPALAVLGILVLAGMAALYPWVGRASPAGAYLNVPFFVVRWVIYWAVWVALAELLRATRAIEDAGDIRRATRRYRVISSAGLVLLGLTMAFASYDWIMSLTPDWASTIYGVYWFAGGVLSGLALFAVLALPTFTRDSFAPVSTDDVHSLGKLLTTFVLFWLYIGFAQYIVIYSGDLPSEVTWYVARSRDGWGYVAAVLIFGNFVFPFLLLLFRFVKRTPVLLATVALALVGLHFLDTFWLVMPGVFAVRWWTVVLMIAVGLLVMGATFALATWRGHPLPSGRAMPVYGAVIPGASSTSSRRT